MQENYRLIDATPTLVRPSGHPYARAAVPGLALSAVGIATYHLTDDPTGQVAGGLLELVGLAKATVDLYKAATRERWRRTTDINETPVAQPVASVAKR